VNKKQKAFILFEQGKTASSPEVKALKLKGQSRYNYFYEWKKGGKASDQISKISQSLPSGEAIGAIDETKKVSKEATAPKPENQEESKEVKEPNSEGMIKDEEGKEDLAPKEAPPEKPKAKDESIGAVSEVAPPKGKDGQPEGPERKIATVVADDGIKCTVFLSLQTLALFRIAATTQAQIDDGEELSLGDFLDTCAEDFFRVRGKKLGLISTGGK